VVCASIFTDRADRTSPGFVPWAGTLSSGAEGTRTPDPLHAMEVRYQLRHSPGTSPHGPVKSSQRRSKPANRACPPDNGWENKRRGHLTSSLL
jgi:hypothetical protein